MHELSIADAIVAVALESAEGRRVERVTVRVGHLRQVVPSALAFAFELVTGGTAADGAELVLREVPAEGRCLACGARSVLHAFPLRCAACGGLDVEVMGGEELRLEEIEVTDDQQVFQEA